MQQASLPALWRGIITNPTRVGAEGLRQLDVRDETNMGVEAVIYQPRVIIIRAP